MNALRTAIDFFGTQQKLADELDVTQAAVSNWLRNRRKLKPEMALRIERITGGRVTLKDLCPHLFPAARRMPRIKRARA